MMDTVKIKYQGTVFDVGEVRYQLADDPGKLARFVLADIIDNPHPIIEPEEPEEPEIIEEETEEEPEECEECMIPEIEEQESDNAEPEAENAEPEAENAEPETTEEPEITEETEPELICPVCGKRYTSERWYRKHVEGHDESIGD